MVALSGAACVGLLLGAIGAWFLSRSGVTSREVSSFSTPMTSGERAEAKAIAAALEHGESVYLPTGNPDEYVVYATADTRPSGAKLPTDLARAAVSGLSKSLVAAVEAAKASGHLVMVDGATAKAIRKGALATDKSGRSLAVVRGAGGKYEHLARLSPAAGKAAGTAMGAANVLGAVSTQMQMAAIEAKLSEIVEVVGNIETVQRRELDSSILATRQLVGEVVGASREAGFLPAESWAQIAPHYKSIIQDQQMARGAVSDLIDNAKKSPKGFWLDNKSTSIKTNRDLLEERLHTLKEADLNAIRMHMVRLWHYTVTQPELAPYFDNLARAEVENQRQTEARLIEAAQGSISRHGELAGIAKVFHWSKRDEYRQQVDEFSRIAALNRPLGLEIEAVVAAPEDPA